MRNTYEVRRTGQGFAVRPAARPKARRVGPLGHNFLSLDLGRAVRLVLALLLYILRLRLDSQMLSHKRGQEIRGDILRLVQQLTSADPQAQAEAAPHPAAMATPIAAPRPMPRAPAPVRTTTTPPLPRPYARRLPETAANSIVLDGMSQQSLGELSLSELREFVRVAARDTKPMFEQALLAAYRRQLMAMFFGPFSVKQESEDFNYPDFLLICRGGKTLQLKRSIAGKAAAPDAYEMLREYWYALKRPQHFRIEQQEGEFARELLNVAGKLRS